MVRSGRYALWKFLAFLFALAVSYDALAHEVRPGYLELREIDAQRFDVLWKVPARGDKRLALSVRLPDNCQAKEPATRFVGGAFIERWRTDCDGGLNGQRISIDGLENTGTDVLVRVQRQDGDSQTIRLTPDAVAFSVAGTQSNRDLVKTYTALGLEHILLGIDHLLFVLGLLWVVRETWTLVKTITAFTVAHSLTLGAATFGWIGVPMQPVEAAIALSIVLVAVEAIKANRGEEGLASRYPWLVAFAFGLLHGLGFASALADVGIPNAEVPLALLFFNLGVEIGQLAFILVVTSSIRALRLMQLKWSRWSEVVTIYLVGTTAAFWFVERTTRMFVV